MNERGSALPGEDLLTERTFVSFATANRKEALAICEAIERRGESCWISCRDVEPGENYQEAIVRQIREARALVLVLSEAANNSDEIKKELSLASRYHVPVIALRIEEIEPSDAFAYELSTRQWIDALTDWDKSLDALARKIAQISNGGRASRQQPLELPVAGGSRRFRFSKSLTMAVAVISLLAVTGAAWIFLRPHAPIAHNIVVRLTGFDRLSADVPPGLPIAMRDEIIAAFADGTVSVSTAAAPSAGSSPAYALSATVRRDGDQIRVIAKLVNERAGTTLWSNGFKYSSSETTRIPRWAAIDVSDLLHCGLFAASTYPKPLPDPILSDYMQVCQSGWGAQPARALEFARKVVTAAPDFSWGWSAVEGAAANWISEDPTSPRVTALRKEALEAAERAISLDPTNSDALEIKSTLIDQNDLVSRADLLRRAAAVRSDVAYHHFSYGGLLDEVGRSRDAIAEYRRSLDLDPQIASSHVMLGLALLRDGETKEAKRHFDAAKELSPEYRYQLTMFTALISENDYSTALRLVDDKQDFTLSAGATAAYHLGFRALLTRDSQDRANAIRALTSLPPARLRETGVLLLGSLGAYTEAVRAIEAGINAQRSFWRGLLFYPSLAGARSNPAFRGVAQRMGLITYWKTTHTKPDVCLASDAPPFCGSI